MKPKVLIVVSIICLILAAAIFAVLIWRGTSFQAAIVFVGILFIFWFIAIKGAARSLTSGNKQLVQVWPWQKMPSQSLALLAISPVLVGLIVYLTYPVTYLTLILILVLLVMIAASLFYFLR